MNLLDELRDIVPDRRLSITESYVLAERQATALLERRGVDAAPVPTAVIADLPFVRVALNNAMEASGETKWQKPRWLISLHATEPAVRQRFSLAHEFKHILDHKRRQRFYPLIMNLADKRRHEQLCDYFAASLLMPRTWVKQAYSFGVQDEFELARLFQVSTQAMQFRLRQLGIVDPYERCSEMNSVYLRQLPASSLGLAA